MATETNIELTESWQEVADGPALITLVTGGEFWVHNAASAPTDDTAYLPILPDEKYYQYSGTQKTFAKVPRVTGAATIINPTEIA